MKTPNSPSGSYSSSRFGVGADELEQRAHPSLEHRRGPAAEHHHDLGPLRKQHRPATPLPKAAEASSQVVISTARGAIATRLWSSTMSMISTWRAWSSTAHFVASICHSTLGRAPEAAYGGVRRFRARPRRTPGGPAPARSSPPTGPRPAVPAGRGDTGSCATSRVRSDVAELLGHDHVLDIRPHPAAATSTAGGLTVMG
jgi:hypothetical protein